MFKLDGHVRAVEASDLKVGVVLRMLSGWFDEASCPECGGTGQNVDVFAPFSDCVVISVKNGEVKLDRPHKPGKSEVFVVSVERLVWADSLFRTVLTSRGVPYVVNLDL
jgi:hypothetical protein